MDFLRQIWALFHKPFPMEESRKSFFRTTVLLSIFVTLFLYIYRPFDMSQVENKSFFWVCLGFGAMTFLGTLTFDFLTKYVFRIKIDAASFTLGKWILYMFGVMFFISLFNFLYVRLYYFGYIMWEYFPYMIRSTFMIGILPIFFVGAWTLIRKERKYKNIATELNGDIIDAKKQPLIHDESMIFDISSNQIRYVESLQNYVKIGFINEENQWAEKVERATLKSILTDTNGSSIVRCHRSYLVNQAHIQSISGNAQGLILTLTHCDKEIPVSRSFVGLFRSK